MAGADGEALFYPSELPAADQLRLVRGALSLPDAVRLDFPEEGGDVDRVLAVPYRAGMDAIEVDAAGLQVAAEPRLIEISGYTVTKLGGANAGLVIELARPARLARVVLSYPTFPKEVSDMADRYQFLGGKVQSRPDGTPVALRLVVRPATRQGSSFNVAPPAYAEPSFAAPGPMYPPVLAGLKLQDQGSGRFLVIFPSVLGSAWLLQLAYGEEATKLSAVAFDTAVQSVTLDGAPTDLSLALRGDGGDTPLWNYANLLLPATGPQDAAFTSLAESFLGKRLAELAATCDAVTLGLPLRFHSAAGGRASVSAHTLAARYVVRPLGADPVTLSLRGGPVALGLAAPPGLRPDDGGMRLTARLLGRALNAGSPEPPASRPVAGVRITPARWAAAAIVFQPVEGAAAGNVLPLASVRVYVQAMEDAELAVEIHGDAAGAPGPVTAGPLTARLAKGEGDWCELELPSALPVVTGHAPLWLVLRSTKGEVLWFTIPLAGLPPAVTAAPRPGPLVSADRGGTWAEVDSVLSTPGLPLAQLFHALPDPQPRPALRLSGNGATLVADWFAGASTDGSPSRYVAEARLPSAALALLAGPGGADLAVFSRTALDLTLENVELLYSPFQAGGG